VRNLQEIESKPIRWLWRHRIPSKLAVLAGMPGCGKSQLTIAVTAVLTTAGNWITGEPCELGRVIFVAAEDDPGDTIRPRLEAAGGDLDYVQVVDGDRDEKGKPIPRTLDAVDKLAAHCLRYVKDGDVPVRLIVIDPISSYFGRHDSHNTAEVRGLLAPLLTLADEHGITIPAVTHLNKSEGSNAANRVTGSGALVAASRAAFVVGEHLEIDDAYCMATLKTNLSPEKTGVGYRVVPVTVGAIDTSRVEWIPGVVDVDADTLLAPKKDKWRALAAPPDQRRLALPVSADGDETDDVELVVRTDSDGRRRVVLVASVTWTDAATVDALAEQLHAAAAEIRKHDTGDT